jgi:hypothetical protein
LPIENSISQRVGKITFCLSKIWRRCRGHGIAAPARRRNCKEGVEQLSRYLDLLRRDTLLGAVRGILAAQLIKPQAKVLANDRGISCVRIDYDLLRGLDSAEQPAVLTGESGLVRLSKLRLLSWHRVVRLVPGLVAIGALDALVGCIIGFAVLGTLIGLILHDALLGCDAVLGRAALLDNIVGLIGSIADSGITL